MAIKKDMLVEKYIEALESGTIPWEKGWTTTRLHNPITGTTYTGINRIWLTFASYLKGYKDSRWFTFNEISNEKKFHPGEKWHLKKGAEGVEIKKKPIYYNEVEDKWYNSKQYYKKLATLNDVEKEIFKDECKVIGDGKGSYYIFNADEIEGIASEQIIEVDSMTVEKMQTIIENMGVGYEEVMQDKTFYSPELDAIITPPKERFKDEAAYFKTLLHELSHATGHANRLNRDLSGEPGSMSYAKEELRADIGAAFLMADFGLEFDESHVQNHLAYIQSWAEVLKNDKNVLLEAVKDAEMINDYILEMSKERQLTLTQTMEHSALDINEYHVELHGCDEGIDYTVFDNTYRSVDGGIIELNAEDTLLMNDFVEFIANERLNIDFTNYECKRADYEELMEKVETMCLLDEEYARSFNVDQMGYYVSEILDNGELVLDAHEDYRMFFTKDEAEMLSKELPKSHVTDNSDFVETLKSNIVKGLQTQSEVNEIYKKPDIEVLKNLKIDKPQINKTITFGRGR